MTTITIQVNKNTYIERKDDYFLNKAYYKWDVYKEHDEEDNCYGSEFLDSFSTLKQALDSIPEKDADILSQSLKELEIQKKKTITTIDEILNTMDEYKNFNEDNKLLSPSPATKRKLQQLNELQDISKKDDWVIGEPRMKGKK